MSKIQMPPGLVLDQTSYNSCINAAGEALPAAWCYAAVQLSSMASMACERDQISALEALEALASFSWIRSWNFDPFSGFLLCFLEGI